MNKELASRALGKSGFLVPKRDRQRPSLGDWAPTATSPRTLPLAHTSVLRDRQRCRKRQEAAGGKQLGEDKQVAKRKPWGWD